MNVWPKNKEEEKIKVKASSALKLLVTAGIVSGLVACGSDTDVSYKTDVAPILSKYCDECHLKGGEGTENTDFVVENYDTVMKGTKFGPVIVAGDSTSSTLYRLVTGKVDKSIEMPHEKTEKLNQEELSVIQHWIDQGANNN
jgi:hypothetical protein